MAEYVQVLTATDNEDEAVKIASILTDERLAACVQIVGPIRSLYWWEGKVQDEKEWQLHIKTTAKLASEVEKAIKDNHSYDVPEVIVLPIIGGSADYLGWVTKLTRKPGVS